MNQSFHSEVEVIKKKKNVCVRLTVRLTRPNRAIITPDKACHLLKCHGARFYRYAVVLGCIQSLNGFGVYIDLFQTAGCLVSLLVIYLCASA